MKQFLISKNDSGQRLDKFISKSVPLMPKGLAYKYIRIKRIKLNKKRCTPQTMLCEGDVLELYINDEFFENKINLDFLKSTPDIDVVYEDENVIIINKQVGIVCHSDVNNSYETLVNKMKHYLYNKKEYIPENENSFSPALCNRIDRNTAGLVIGAKNASSLRIINEKIKNDEIKKFYLCLVYGQFEKSEGDINCFIRKDCGTNTVSVFEKFIKGAKTAHTKYKVLKSNNEISLVEVELVTGRTHQIRAVMDHLGHSLVGDSKYSHHKTSIDSNYEFQALCSYKIIFDFKSPSGGLGYLNGKEISLDNNIYNI